MTFPDPNPVPASPPVSSDRKFSGELSANFQELRLQLERRGSLDRALPRLLVFVLQPILGALPHQAKAHLEKAVGNSLCFHPAGATGFNILMNMVLYPLTLMVLAAAWIGVDVLFSQRINGLILLGVLFGALEGAFRLREGIFQARPAQEMVLRGSVYGGPLARCVQSLMERGAGVMRSLTVPVDGFYGKGFVEKLERERRYGSVYTVEDWGKAYFVRLEFPHRVPEMALSLRPGLPEEMPDYDYDLALKDGCFIIKGSCPDEKIRKVSSSVGAFPPEFATVIPLEERVEGFCHRRENKLLEVLLLKQRT